MAQLPTLHHVAIDQPPSSGESWTLEIVLFGQILTCSICGILPDRDAGLFFILALFNACALLFTLFWRTQCCSRFQRVSDGQTPSSPLSSEWLYAIVLVGQIIGGLICFRIGYDQVPFVFYAALNGVLLCGLVFWNTRCCTGVSTRITPRSTQMQPNAHAAMCMASSPPVEGAAKATSVPVGQFPYNPAYRT